MNRKPKRQLSYKSKTKLTIKLDDDVAEILAPMNKKKRDSIINESIRLQPANGYN